jgi:hypothetical protein
MTAPVEVDDSRNHDRARATKLSPHWMYLALPFLWLGSLPCIICPASMDTPGAAGVASARTEALTCSLAEQRWNPQGRDRIEFGIKHVGLVLRDTAAGVRARN